MPKKEEPKKPTINFTPLNDLILSPEKKEALIAVIQQRDNQSKIFDDWGLGDVIEYGRGMTMLFHGSPGVGKTYAARKIAECLGKELLTMDNGRLASSEPGAMERNIQGAFEDAKRRDMVVLFDECDSLLTNRNSVGMIIGSEINCLLTEIEKFEGVCILTTNRLFRLDEALERRISLTLKFGKPKLEARIQIWKNMLPKKLPLGKNVSIEELATHELTGGLIKNVVLNAARFAAGAGKKRVEKEDFERAFTTVVKAQEQFAGKEAFMSGQFNHSDKKRS